MSMFFIVLFGLVGGALGYGAHRTGNLSIPRWKAVSVGALGGVVGGLVFKYVFYVLMAVIGAAVVLVMFGAGRRRR